MIKRPVFDSFTEYWYYVRYLSEEQRKIIFKNLSIQQKKFLDNSYIKEGWSDLFYRNEIDEKLDELKEAYGYDVLEIRAKVLAGKSVYVPTKFWEILEEQLAQYKIESVNFVIGGLKAIPEASNGQVCLIVSDVNKEEK